MSTSDRATTALLPKSAQPHRPVLTLHQTRDYLRGLFAHDMHGARVLSLSNGVAGVLDTAVLSVHAIGQAYGKLAKITPKAAVKQVDRLLSNKGIDVALCLAPWMQYVVAERDEIVLAMDWTDFDDDDHTTLCVYLITNHGRATPLYWKTVLKSKLKGHRTAIEHEVVTALDASLAEGVRVHLLADRGFGDQKLYELLKELAWDYTIRFRGNIEVQSRDGQVRTAAEWVPRSGRPLKLPEARVTQDRYLVPAVVVVHARRMKDSWCLATSKADWTASEVVKAYGRRFTIEETFRDTKDIHFGKGLRATHIKDAGRRDRLLLLVAIATALLTLLGAASEAAGLDRLLKVNTSKKRTHSLFRQGCYWYDCIPYMRDDWLADLMREFDRIVRQHAVFREIFGVI
jgi:Transposase DDE domain